VPGKGGEGLVIRTEDPTCKCWKKDTEAQTLCTLKIKRNHFLPHSSTTTAAQWGYFMWMIVQ